MEHFWKVVFDSIKDVFSVLWDNKIVVSIVSGILSIIGSLILYIRKKQKHFYKEMNQYGMIDCLQNCLLQNDEFYKKVYPNEDIGSNYDEIILKHGYIKNVESRLPQRITLYPKYNLVVEIINCFDVADKNAEDIHKSKNIAEEKIISFFKKYNSIIYEKE